ncbi:MAG: tRNA threonylcarbamoyladenosine biosynthesis protein TsaB [Chlamydiae bacterium]|nr:tRNA threonylcarbamoyladenosine biosynthesis protein TsaB [Chlamydiota bacterium]
MNALILDKSYPSPLLGQMRGQKIIKQLSEPLFPALENFCDLEELDLIAVGTGPGSYMGVRAAATIAKTLAFAKDLPLIEFPSPLAFLPPGYEGHFVFVGDAKMGQLFILTGEVRKGQVPIISPPQLIAPADLDLTGMDFIVGDGFLPPEPNLDWVALYVHEQWTQGKTLDANSLTLTYLR